MPTLVYPAGCTRNSQWREFFHHWRATANAATLATAAVAAIMLAEVGDFAWRFVKEAIALCHRGSSGRREMAVYRFLQVHTEARHHSITSSYLYSANKV